MERVSVGVVGCGVIARNTYLPGIVAAAESIELVAVCDAQPSLAESAAEQFGAYETYTSYDEMLARAPIDAVVVLTNIQAHSDNVLAALRAGKHVYTEKTLATTLEAADELIEEASRRNVLLACAPPVMLSAANQRVKRLVAEGAIGRVNFVRARHSHAGPAHSRNWPADPTWFYKKGAGPILDLGVYAFHTITGILGPAKRVTAFLGIAMPERPILGGPAKGKTIDVEAEDNGLILLDFGNATYAVVDGTYCVVAAKGPRMELFGSEGTININDRGAEVPLELYREDQATGKGSWQPVEVDGAGGAAGGGRGGWSLASGVTHLAECIREGKQPVISAEHARHCLEIMLKAMDASRTGVAQDITSTF